jgi:hypothetical protein
MNRRGFLGTLVSSFVGAMMIRSLGQTEILVPPTPYQKTVTVNMGVGMIECIAAEDLCLGDLVNLGADGKVRKCRGEYPLGVCVDA